MLAEAVEQKQTHTIFIPMKINLRINTITSNEITIG